jgi:hypothetical protein
MKKLFAGLILLVALMLVAQPAGASGVYFSTFERGTDGPSTLNSMYGANPPRLVAAKPFYDWEAMEYIDEVGREGTIAIFGGGPPENFYTYDISSGRESAYVLDIGEVYELRQLGASTRLVGISRHPLIYDRKILFTLDLQSPGNSLRTREFLLEDGGRFVGIEVLGPRICAFYGADVYAYDRRDRSLTVHEGILPMWVTCASSSVEAGLWLGTNGSAGENLFRVPNPLESPDLWEFESKTVSYQHLGQFSGTGDVYVHGDKTAWLGYWGVATFEQGELVNAVLIEEQYGGHTIWDQIAILTNDHVVFNGPIPDPDVEWGWIGSWVEERSFDLSETIAHYSMTGRPDVLCPVH